MNFRQLEAFQSTMRLGSVTTAAKALYISQPSVSRLLADLETSIDVKLFEHCKGRLNPTREAELFYDEIERTFTGLNLLRQTAQQLKKFTLGNLRVGGTPALSLDLITNATTAFSRQYEKTNISLRMRSSRRITEWTSTYQIDLGIVSSFFDTPRVNCLYKSCLCCVVVLPEGHPLAKKEIIACGDLEEESIISLERDFLLGHLSKNNELEKILQKYTLFETELGFSACQLVCQGLGVSIVDPFSAYHFRQKGLVIREIDIEIPFYFAIIHAENRQFSLVTQSFLPILLSQIETICSEDFFVKIETD
jgi:DNA-binding transcriptional LysR family regulator